jgi:L-asparaginase
MSNHPVVGVAALGGTIAMGPSASTSGVVPKLTAEDLLGSLGEGLAMDVEATTISSIPSPSLDFATLGRCHDWAAKQAEADAAGIVVVQGTDTLEETAYFFALTWPFEAPIVVTGAMRHPSLASADGPANLLGALTVAAAPASRDRGSLVVFNDEIHQARWVSKAHSSRLDAFSSNPAGPAGMIAEGAVHYFHRADIRQNALDPHPTAEGGVPLLEAGLDDTGELLDIVVAAGAPGVVIAAGGAGHVSERAAEAIERALSTIPVVIASRTGAGPTFRSTYGYRGSESDLTAMGATMAGWLSPRKARILLRLLLATGANRVRIEDEFRLRGDLP